MSEPVIIEEIKYVVTNPKVSLPGLTDVETKLRAIDAALASLNGRLSGLSTNSAFKRTRAELQGLFDAATKTKGIKVEDAAAAVGIPNLADFKAYVAKWKAVHQDWRKTFSDAKAGEFRSTGKAAEFTQGYLRTALKNAQGPVDALQAMFGKGSSATAGAQASGPIHASVSGPITLTIPASQIVARIEGVVAGGSVAGASGGGGSGGAFTPKGGGAGTPSGGGAFVQEIVTESNKGRRIARKEMTALGETTESFFKQVGEELKQTKTRTVTSAVTKAREQFAKGLEGLRQNTLQSLASPESMRKAASQLDSFAGGLAGGHDLEHAVFARGPVCLCFCGHLLS